MGVTFVVPAGLFYRQKKNRWGALWGSVWGGAVVMAVMSFPINCFISYPFYVRSGMMSMEAIMDAVATLPSVQTLPQALLIFNIPFTLVKAACRRGHHLRGV